MSKNNFNQCNTWSYTKLSNNNNNNNKFIIKNVFIIHDTNSPSKNNRYIQI